VGARKQCHPGWAAAGETVQRYLAEIISDPRLSNTVGEEAAIFPGLEGVLRLFQVHMQVKGGDFERVILDASSTDETMRLLTIPDTLHWYASHLGQSNNGVGRVLQAFAGGLVRVPGKLVQALSMLDEAATQVRQTLHDPDISSYRVVVQPGKTVVREAQRAITALSLFDFPVDGLMINQVLPEAANDSAFWQKRRAL
jgi:arsenite/tail-anchored protein-transporting ATPase